MVIILVTGVNPIDAYAAMFGGTFGSVWGLGETLLIVTPLLLIAAGLVLPFKAKIWNLGAEGQLYAGAIIGVGLGLYAPIEPPYLMIPLVFVMAFLAGATWAMVPALMKAKMGLNEIIPSFMMNFVALYLTQYLTEGPWRNPASEIDQTFRISEAFRLPILVDGTRLHTGFLVSVLAIVVVYVIMEKTTLGYELTMIGGNPTASRMAGINVSRNIILSMAIAGGLAGVAGLIEVFGKHFTLIGAFGNLAGISPGFGYIAVVVALLGASKALGVGFSSLFIGIIFVGSGMMQRAVQVPSTFLDIMTAAVIITVIVIGRMDVSRIWRSHSPKS
jgi:simple sugar transport system permease protein